MDEGDADWRCGIDGRIADCLARRGRRGITGASISEPIIEDIKYSPAEYVGAPSQRDFFYVTKKKNPS